MSAPVYLDCAATTPIDPRVRQIVLRHLDEEFGNAGSRTHDYGLRARRSVEKARQQVADAVGAGRGEVFFTSGATESNNLAILGLAAYGQRTGRRHLISTRIEHHAVLEPVQSLAERGFEVTWISPDRSGRIDPADIAAALRPQTLLVSVMQANNETGVIQPIVDIARVLQGHEAYLHVDAAQGFGRELESLRQDRVDLVSLSGHKVFAPKGVGALVARRRGGARPPITPLMLGGGQELGLRPGTLPVALIAGLGLASELAIAEFAERRRVCLQFRRQLIDALQPLEPTQNGEESCCLPHIINLSFPKLTAEAAMEAVKSFVAISNGSACTSASLTCSHVLGAMGIDAEHAEGATRWSWCHFTPEPDWDSIVHALRG